MGETLIGLNRFTLTELDRRAFLKRTMQGAALLAAGIALANDTGTEGASEKHIPARTERKDLDVLREEFLKLQLGIFMHFGMATYHQREWATGKEPPSSFNPVKLDCDQWAEAGKAMGARYSIMTTQHVGGFALWDTSVSDYDVASSPHGKDIVREYVDAFRKRDFEVGLYYAIWNGHHDITRGNVTPEKVEHVKTQLRELMTNYGPVRLIWLDGYQNEKRGRTKFPSTSEVPFDEIYGLIKELQPNCLVMRHKGLGYYDPEYTDVQIWEYLFSHQETWAVWERFQKEHPGVVSEICETLQRDWYWKEDMPAGELLSADYVAEKLAFAGQHNANYILNVAVNREGLFDANAVERLHEIGETIRARGLLA